MASNPTYDPSIFVNGIKPELFAQLNDPASGFPSTTARSRGQYAPGSTFKLVTASAALDEGPDHPHATVNDTGSIEGRQPDLQERRRESYGHSST